jgi:hypothetical protein
MYIVIPCYDEPDLISTLQSLKQCALPQEQVKVLVIINQSETESERVLTHNQNTYSQATKWAKLNSTSELNFEIQQHTLAAKHAGVGLARRRGMDTAADYFLHQQNHNGVIVCLDADCTVAKNYLVEIEKHFERYPQTPAASIYYEHDLDACDSEENYTAILNYELYLRYYIEGLRYTNYPFAYHTIGSSMAVRAGVYKKQGGMNKRKAGEDFYFLHKIMPLGNFTEINTTTVYPSSRASHRVPFGTGKAVNDWFNQKEKVFTTYHPEIFEEVKQLIESIKNADRSINFSEWGGELSKQLKEFITQIKGEEAFIKAQQNAATEESLKKRWMTWWDGFKVLKLVHFLRDKQYPNTTLQAAAITLLTKNKKAVNDNQSLYDLLMFYREIQRKG